MTLTVLFAFHRNQQFLDENASNMYSDKFTAPEELKFTNEFIVIAVIVKGEKPELQAFFCSQNIWTDLHLLWCYLLQT